MFFFNRNINNNLYLFDENVRGALTRYTCAIFFSFVFGCVRENTRNAYVYDACIEHRRQKSFHFIIKSSGTQYVYDDFNNIEPEQNLFV